MNIRIAGTINDSIVDGEGLRYTIFVQGCPHKCEGCHNPDTHDFNGGKLVSTESLFREIKKNPLLDGVTFSGGEPFCQCEELAELGEMIKTLGLNILTYTGYDFEYLLNHRNESGIEKLLSVSDYVMDGKFEKDKKSYNLRFRGSSNQRYIDCRRSLEENKIIVID